MVLTHLARMNILLVAHYKMANDGVGVMLSVPFECLEHRHIYICII